MRRRNETPHAKYQVELNATPLKFTRSQPRLIEAVPHSYEDKFLLAEYLTNTALLAQLNCLEMLGIQDYAPLKCWVQQGSCVTLAFCCSERWASQKNELKS